MAPPLIALPLRHMVVLRLDPVVDDAPAEYGFVACCPGVSDSISLGTDDNVSSVVIENVHDFGNTHDLFPAMLDSHRKQGLSFANLRLFLDLPPPKFLEHLHGRRTETCVMVVRIREYLNLPF